MEAARALANLSRLPDLRPRAAECGALEALLEVLATHRLTRDEDEVVDEAEDGAPVEAAGDGTAAPKKAAPTRRREDADDGDEGGNGGGVALGGLTPAAAREVTRAARRMLRFTAMGVLMNLVGCEEGRARLRAAVVVAPRELEDAGAEGEARSAVSLLALTAEDGFWNQGEPELAVGVLKLLCNFASDGSTRDGGEPTEAPARRFTTKECLGLLELVADVIEEEEGRSVETADEQQVAASQECLDVCADLQRRLRAVVEADAFAVE